jgi:hypothetical protein
MSSLGKSDNEAETARQTSNLRTYALAGRRGLRVSPISLGAGTFGDAWDPAWQSPPDEIDRIIDAYLAGAMTWSSRQSVVSVRQATFTRAGTRE